MCYNATTNKTTTNTSKQKMIYLFGEVGKFWNIPELSGTIPDVLGKFWKVPEYSGTFEVLEYSKTLAPYSRTFQTWTRSSGIVLESSGIFQNFSELVDKK